jgi:uncharacterized phiE125 gp8 family phage protein
MVKRVDLMTTLAAFTKHVSFSTAVTDATLFPTSDLKKQLNLPSTATEDETWLTNAASVARSLVERSIPGGIAIRLQTKQLILNKFPTSYDDEGEIELPFPPFNAVSSIKYYDESNNSTSLASSDYRVIDPGNGNRAGLYRLIDKVWPTTRLRKDAVTVEFTCGSTCSTDVSPTIKHAVSLLVSHWYENRSATFVGVVSKEMELGLQSLLAANGYGFYG